MQAFFSAPLIAANPRSVATVGRELSLLRLFSAASPYSTSVPLSGRPEKIGPQILLPFLDSSLANQNALSVAY